MVLKKGFVENMRELTKKASKKEKLNETFKK